MKNIKEKAYKEDEIIELLKEAGFKTIESFFEAFGFAKTRKETERINFIAIK